MLNPPKATAILAATLISSAFAGQEVQPSLGDCEIDWADSYTAGGSLGSSFCASQIGQGQVINGLKTWAGSHSMNGMQVLYENGDCTTIGTLEGSYNELLWNPAEQSISELYMNPPTQDSLLTGFRMVLNDGREIVVAISGMTGNFGIEQLTWKTSPNAPKTVIHDVQYHPTTDELNDRKTNEDRGLFDEDVMGGYMYHDGVEGDPNITYHFKDSFKYTHTRQWTKSSSDTTHIGIGVEIEHEVNFIAIDDKATASGEFFWEHKKEKTNMDSTSEEHLMELWVDVPVMPGQGAHVIGSSVHGKLDVTWSGKQTTTFTNGKNFTIDVSGTLKDENFSQGWLHTTYINKEEMLQALEAGENLIGGDGNLVSEASKKDIVAKLKTDNRPQPSLR